MTRIFKLLCLLTILACDNTQRIRVDGSCGPEIANEAIEIIDELNQITGDETIVYDMAACDVVMCSDKEMHRCGRCVGVDDHHVEIILYPDTHRHF